MSTLNAGNLAYVVKSEDLLALNYLPRRYPVPAQVEWIDRGTDRKLSPTRLEQLFRTYHRSDPSPSIVKLRDAAGIRLSFASETERLAFASAFGEACNRERSDRARFLTAIYNSIEDAEDAVAALAEAGVPSKAMSMLWHASRYMHEEFDPPHGHSRRRVLAGVSAGGVVAAAIGAGVLLIPGVGPVAATGAIISSAYSSVATASGIIGATCAAMATMATDQDVEEVAANHLEEQLRRGSVFLSIDHTCCELPLEGIGSLVETNGGRIV